jgi:uncharacterized protein YraI
MRLNTPAPLPALAAAAAVCAAAAGLPGQALAQSSPLARPALTMKSVHLRAGPSRDYPAIAVLPRGTAVWVEGCLRDISWCDVTAGIERGWIYALNLSFEVQGELVPVPRWAPEIGIGIIGFLLGSYWAEHYRDRPWYAERDRWHRPPHALPAPPASPRPRPPQPPRVAPPPAHSSPPPGSPGPPPAGPPRPSRPPVHPPGRGPDAQDEPHRRTGPACHALTLRAQAGQEGRAAVGCPLRRTRNMASCATPVLLLLPCTPAPAWA